MYAKLVDVVEADVVKMTGCAVPCTYSEYRLTGKPILVDSSQFGLQLGFASLEAVEEREGLVYEIISFISEVGGALGLFLGLSFLDSWTIMEFVFSAFFRNIKKI